MEKKSNSLYNKRVKHEIEYEKPQGEIKPSGGDSNDRHGNINVIAVNI